MKVKIKLFELAFYFQHLIQLEPGFVFLSLLQFSGIGNELNGTGA